MIQLPKVLKAWGRPEFADVLKDAVAGSGSELPLQAGLTAGSFALEKPLEIMLISASETNDSIEAKVGVFYRSLMPGCACAGDPTVEDEQNEYATVLVSINRRTAEAAFKLLEE